MKSRALIEHFEALGFTEDTLPDSWYDNEVFTIAEFNRFMMERDYYPLYAEVHGKESVADLSLLSDEAMEQTMDLLHEQYEANVEDLRDLISDVEDFDIFDDDWLDEIEEVFEMTDSTEHTLH